MVESVNVEEIYFRQTRMSIGEGNSCSLDNPLAASTNDWVRQHSRQQAAQGSFTSATASREHFGEPKAAAESSLDAKSNQASANNPFARHHPAPPPPAAARGAAESAVDPKSNQVSSGNPLAPAHQPAASRAPAASGAQQPSSWSPAQVAAFGAQLGWPV